jgi:hypothetical protein
VLVLPVHRHRVDHHLASVVEVEHDELAQIAGCVAAGQESAGGFVVEIADHSCVVQSVADLTVSDAVLAGGPVELHVTPQS